MHIEGALGHVGADQRRLRLYSLALANVGSWLRGVGACAAMRFAQLYRQSPERVIIAPQDLRTTDPTEAAEIYGGYFTLAGQMVSCQGQSPFSLEPPSTAWAEELTGFGWLRHLGAADSALAHANARALVDDFLRGGLDRRGIAARPRVIARRLLSFLSQSPLVLDGADHAFYRVFMKALHRSTRQLERQVGLLDGESKLLVLVALTMAGLCLDKLGRVQKRSSRQLGEELARQILSDGGHISRNPRVLVDMLAELLPLRQVYAARGVTPPPQLLGAIDRMMPMLRMFRLGEGSLALFNGMGVTEPGLIATLLAYDDTRSRAIEHARHSGYERLESGRLVLVADVGIPPPARYSREAHAGCLSFELSVGRSRLIVNCGSPAQGSGIPTLAARSTAAHSTATINDASSCIIAGSPAQDSLIRNLGVWLGMPIIGGVESVDVSRANDDEALTLGGAHDGYRSRFGVIHQRRWRLDGGREILDGEDAFIAVEDARSGLSATLRFHLHPAVRSMLTQDGYGVTLTLPEGEVWSFEVERGRLDIEESVFFSSADGGARRSEQIVVTVDLAEARLLRWRFLRNAA